MKILIVGGGGREHAIAKKLAENPKVEKMWAAPGNGGMASLCTLVPLKATDVEGVVAFCKENPVDYVVVAQDDPLCLGMVDALAEIGVPAFGPTKAAALAPASDDVNTLHRKPKETANITPASPAAANCAQIRDAMNTLEEAKANITQSALVYQSYANSVSIARGFYENGQLSGEGMKVIGDYLNTNAGPSSQYPNGTFPYIMEQQALSDDAINDETAFLSELIEKYANNLTEGAIETTYQVLDATEGYASTEDASALFDGDSSTKWCHNHKGGLSYVVFKAEEPITPSYYRLQRS